MKRIPKFVKIAGFLFLLPVVLVLLPLLFFPHRTGRGSYVLAAAPYQTIGILKREIWHYGPLTFYKEELIGDVRLFTTEDIDRETKKLKNGVTHP